MITNEEEKDHLNKNESCKNINELEFQGHIKGPSIIVDFEVLTMKVILD